MRAQPLAADEKSQAQLNQKLASLTLPLPAGQPTSPLAARIHKRSFSIKENATTISRVSLAFDSDRCIFTMQDARGEHHIPCAFGRWLPSDTELSVAPLKLVPTPVPNETKNRIACSAAWSDDNTLVMNWRFIETAHYDQVTCRFADDEIRVQFKKSLSVINPNTIERRPVLVGKLSS